jgi:CheY-specific phosphatase CheX
MAILNQIPKHVEKAIEDTFKIQLKCLASVKNVTRDPKFIAANGATFDCLGTVDLYSTSYIGQMSLALPQRTYLNILERLLGERHHEVNSENSDGIAEILNIIFSASRRKMNEGGFDFKLAIPSAVVGGQVALKDKAAKGNSLFFECGSDLGEFLVILTLQAVAVDSAC